MATRPQSNDSEHIPRDNSAPEQAHASNPLTREELDALCEFFRLLDKWDRKDKIA
jgi:hypothetical protein